MVFLTAACMSARADVLGAQVVDHNLRWNDLVVLYVEEKKQVSLGRWRVCRLMGITGRSDMFRERKNIQMTKQLMPKQGEWLVICSGGSLKD